MKVSSLVLLALLLVEKPHQVNAILDWFLPILCSLPFLSDLFCPSSPTEPDPIQTLSPSNKPTPMPTEQPSNGPSLPPTITPTGDPSSTPSVTPSSGPSVSPTKEPSEMPSSSPSVSPTKEPSVTPSSGPSVSPTKDPSHMPSSGPSPDTACTGLFDPTEYGSTELGTPRGVLSAPLTVVEYQWVRFNYPGETIELSIESNCDDLSVIANEAWRIDQEGSNYVLTQISTRSTTNLNVRVVSFNCPRDCLWVRTTVQPNLVGGRIEFPGGFRANVCESGFSDWRVLFEGNLKLNNLHGMPAGLPGPFTLLGHVACY